MPPCKTYCAEGNYQNITSSISNHKSLDQDNTALIAVSSPVPRKRA
jgi:alpha-mannosidase